MSMPTFAGLGMSSPSPVRYRGFVFMTQESLDKFVKSDGWSLGGDASIALVKVGANGTVDTTTAPKPVEVFVLTNSGLMGDLSLEGTKITRLNI